MKIGAIYARVSDDKLTEEGARRQDIDRQVDSLKPIAQAWIRFENEKAVRDGKALEWSEDIAIYKDDALSAYKEDWNSRPAFVKLLGEAEGNRVHRCWIESLDRWSRRVADGLLTMERASIKGNMTVVSTMEGEVGVTSSAGWFRCAFGFLMAEWSSRDKSEKTKSGMARRRADKRRTCLTCGVVHLGRHPLTCACPKCRRKGRVETSPTNQEPTRASL
jgi:DNA invertase Pin-like site-specific DNA recombinase